MAAARPALSRREQQVLDIVHLRGSASAGDVRNEMPDAPTDPAVRTTLRALVAKGHLKYTQDGPRYLYSPTVRRDDAQRSELRHVLETFFGGSTESALATLLDLKDGGLTDRERRRLKRLVDAAHRDGR